MRVGLFLAVTINTYMRGLLWTFSVVLGNQV